MVKGIFYVTHQVSQYLFPRLYHKFITLLKISHFPISCNVGELYRDVQNLLENLQMLDKILEMNEKFINIAMTEAKRNIVNLQ